MTNRIQDAFDNIKADPRLKESTKQFLYEKQKKNSSLCYRPVRRYAVSLLCAIFLLIAGAGGYSWIQRPVAYVSIDVNPSIELALNRFDRVVSVTAYNTEGTEILESLSLKGKRYEEAIHEVVESEGMRAYLQDEAELVLTVAAEESRKRELDAGVRRCAGHMGQSCHNAHADMESVSEAHECGLSLGKYNAWLELSKYDSTITAEECADMSMSELRRLIREYRSDGEESECDTDISTDTDIGAGNGGCKGCGEGSSQCHRRHRYRGGGHE